MTTGYLMHKCRVNVPSTVWFDFTRFMEEHNLFWEVDEIYEVDHVV